MSSDRRSSLSARSINSRASVDSSSLRAPQIAPLPTSASLTEGTSIPAPSPPMPPPKDPRDRLQAPMTPQRKPILRKKSPLSAEAFSSPASSMPGAFPTTPSESRQTPQFHTTAYASSPSPQSTPDSKSPKRPGSIRNLLSFKRLRRSYDNTSPGDPGFRPASPSGESITSSMGPSLKKKMSGSFWKRKSSLGMNVGMGDEGGTAIGHTGGYGGELNGNGNGTMPQEGPEGKSSTAALPGEEPLTLNKRKSATFWRRKSSQSLADALDSQNPGWRKTPSDGGGPNRPHRDSDVAMGGMNTEKALPLVYEAPITRSDSPPPQLPEFVGAGGGLGGEDLFRDIH